MAVTDDLIISVLCSGPGSYPLTAKTGINITRLTASNFAAETASVAALVSAYAALTEGTVSGDNISHGNPGSSAYPSAIANRGSKWICTSEDSFGNLYTFTIPAAAAAGNVQSDNITAELTSTAWAAFITAFNALALNPSGDPVTFLRAKLGGRRR